MSQHIVRGDKFLSSRISYFMQSRWIDRRKKNHFDFLRKKSTSPAIVSTEDDDTQTRKQVSS